MLNHKTAIYVPSTNFETAVTLETFHNRINDTQTFLTSLFDGSTTIPNVSGSWLSNDSLLISEEIAIVYSWSLGESLLDHVSEVLEFSQDHAIDWEQESIAVELVRGLYFIHSSSDLGKIGRSVSARILLDTVRYAREEIAQ